MFDCLFRIRSGKHTTFRTTRRMINNGTIFVVKQFCLLTCQKLLSRAKPNVNATSVYHIEIVAIMEAKQLTNIVVSLGMCRRRCFQSLILLYQICDTPTAKKFVITSSKKFYVTKTFSKLIALV